MTNFIVTAYCACALCCGPDAPKPTASGVWPKEGTTIAAPRRIPFGTVVEIEGVGRRIVQDRLSPKYDSRIDVFFNSHKEARRFGKRVLQVRIISTPK